MIGCYDFCGHYEWTFEWLERTGGPELLHDYWTEAIANDSQRHARDLILREGFAGMAKYWQHTLAEESPDLGFHITRQPDLFRIDMHDCPSKGFLLRNGLQQHRDYCDHCIGWVGPLMREAGFAIDHEHNHRGQCWWEFHAIDNAGSLHAGTQAEGPDAATDVRRLAGWEPPGATLDRFKDATSLAEKRT